MKRRKLGWQVLLRFARSSSPLSPQRSLILTIKTLSLLTSRFSNLDALQIQATSTVHASNLLRSSQNLSNTESQVSLLAFQLRAKYTFQNINQGSLSRARQRALHSFDYCRRFVCLVQQDTFSHYFSTLLYSCVALRFRGD